MALAKLSQVKDSKRKKSSASSKKVRKTRQEIQKDYIQRQKEKDLTAFKKRKQEINRRYYLNKKAKLAKKDIVKSEQKAIEDTYIRSGNRLRHKQGHYYNHEVSLIFKEPLKDTIILTLLCFLNSHLFIFDFIRRKDVVFLPLKILKKKLKFVPMEEDDP